MRIFIIGNRYIGKSRLAKKLGDFYHINIFEIDDCSDSNMVHYINNIVRNNKDFIIVGTVYNNIDLLCNVSDTIIFLNFSNKEIKKCFFKRNIFSLFRNHSTYFFVLDKFDSLYVLNLLKKNSRKGIILKNNREVKKYLKSVYESVC